MKIKTTKLQEQLKHASRDQLDQLMSNIHSRTFTEELEHLMIEKKMNKSTLLSKTLLDKNYGYQILQGTRQPSKDKVIQLCLALSCNLEDTNRLLILSNNPVLYSKNKKDALFIYALSNKLTVMETNELIYSYGYELT